MAEWSWKELASGASLGLLLVATLVLSGSGVLPAPATTAAGASATTGAPAGQDSEEVVLFEHPHAAPSLHVTALDGRVVDLASLRGKVVLLNFWATWCGPCKEEIPALAHLQQVYAGHVQVIGMSTDELPPAQVAAKAAALGINYPVAMATADIQQAFGGVPQIPATFVIDPDGQVEQRNRGAQSYGLFEAESRVLLKLPVQAVVHRIDQLSPHGKVGTEDIPGISDDMKALTPEQRQAVLAKLNDQSCDCGCDQSLASCRVEDPNCGYSLPESKKVIEAVKSGGKTR